MTFGEIAARRKGGGPRSRRASGFPETGPHVPIQTHASSVREPKISGLLSASRCQELRLMPPLEMTEKGNEEFWYLSDIFANVWQSTPRQDEKGCCGSVSFQRGAPTNCLYNEAQIPELLTPHSSLTSPVTSSGRLKGAERSSLLNEYLSLITYPLSLITWYFPLSNHP